MEAPQRLPRHLRRSSNLVMAFALGFGICYLMGAVLCFKINLARHFPPDMALQRATSWPYELWEIADLVRQARERKK